MNHRLTNAPFALRPGKIVPILVVMLPALCGMAGLVVVLAGVEWAAAHGLPGIRALGLLGHRRVAIVGGQQAVGCAKGLA